MITTELIETSNAILEIKDDFFFITIKPGVEIELEDMIANINLREEIQQGRKMLVLLDVRNLVYISREARAYGAAERAAEMNIAMAVITGSLTTKLMANFFIKFDKPATPTRMFNSEMAAITWLESFL